MCLQLHFYSSDLHAFLSPLKLYIDTHRSRETQAIACLLRQVIGITEIAGIPKKIEWVLSDGRHSFKATVEPDVADGVDLYSIILLHSFKLVRCPCTHAQCVCLARARLGVSRGAMAGASSSTRAFRPRNLAASLQSDAYSRSTDGCVFCDL